MIKANYRSMIFQTNFNRYSAELVRTISASLRSLRSLAPLIIPKGRGLRPHPVGHPLRFASGSAVFQTALAVLVATT